MKIWSFASRIASVTIFATIASLVTSTTVFSQQRGADGTRGGGSRCAQTIGEVYRLLEETLTLAGPEAFPEFKLAELKRAFENASIKLALSTTAGGIETDASNDPMAQPQLIELNSQRWCRFDEENKAMVLFHELLSLMGLEDTFNYKISERLVILGGAKERSKNKWLCEVNHYWTYWLKDRFGHTRIGYILDGRSFIPNSATGRNAKEAWDKLPKSSRQIGCKTAQSRTRGEAVWLACQEPATISNSCVAL